MNNYINYYYNLFPENIEIKEKNYYFTIKQDKYYFIPYERTIDELKILVLLNDEMIKRNSLIHEIILNKGKEAITIVDGTPYILLRVYINEYKKVDLGDVLFMLDNNDGVVPNKVLNRMNWSELWSSKVDYFEQQVTQVTKTYPLLYKTIDYYIGLAENAISYIKQVELKNNNNIISPITVSHKRVYTDYTLFDLYNPTNLIIDYKIRDISEYIKMAFFNDIYIWDEIKYIFSTYNFSKISLELFYGRLLFPSYYFDIYEDIIRNEEEENKIFNIIEKTIQYEIFLREMYYYINEYTPIEPVGWLIKKAPL